MYNVQNINTSLEFKGIIVTVEQAGDSRLGLCCMDASDHTIQRNVLENKVVLNVM